jgi:peptidoglycan pentaglycine glycine transferase (the first glycine)
VITASGVEATLSRSLRVRECEDPVQWTSVASTLGGSLLQSWEWGEFKRLHGWTAHRLVCERDGQPVAAAQALRRGMGPMSVLYVPRGPMVEASESAALSTLTLEIDRLAAKHRAAVAFLEPEDISAGPPSIEGSLAWSPSRIELQPHRTIKVRIDREDEEILAGMKSKCRYNVRLAGRRGVSIRQGDISEVAAFYELLEETSDRDEFGIHGVEYYADMLDVFEDRSALFLAELNGAIAAGAIILRHGSEAIYMFGASSREYQRHMPTHLLQFEAMRWARDHGCAWYDLWGIPATDTPPEEAEQTDLNVRNGLWGVYRFKQGFGGEVVSYPGVFERQYYPRLINLWRRFRPGPGV